MATREQPCQERRRSATFAMTRSKAAYTSRFRDCYAARGRFNQRFCGNLVCEPHIGPGQKASPRTRRKEG
jgi:hypothetical protein